MKVYRELNSINITRPVVTIGIFDGVHIAHQAILMKLAELANSIKGESTLVTLWPHPRIVLEKDLDSLKLLNTLDEKMIRLEKAGVDNLIVIPFDRKFASTGFDVFIRKILVEKLRMAHLVVGFNHQFGRNREGNFKKLQALSEEQNFQLSQQEAVQVDGEKVSSSAIRKLINAGEIRKANQYLGYNYKVSGKVVGGNQKGREIGFPTANIAVDNTFKIIPKNGVYAVHVFLNGKAYTGMMNIGCRPTLKQKCNESILEVNMFDFNKDIYGQELRIEFIQRLRDERKFENLSALQNQIAIDKKKVLKIISALKNRIDN